MSPLIAHHRSPLAARVLLFAAVAAGSLGFAAQAGATQVSGDTATFTVSDGIEAGQAPVNGPDVYSVDVAVVDGQSVWKLQTESPIRLVSGDCTRISGTVGVAGPSEIHCKRSAAPGESSAILGGGDDSFVAAPGFPDRLRLVGQDGNDTLVGGVADDVINGGDGNNSLTDNEGDDRLTLGSPPRTQQGGFPNGNNTLTGGPGNDFLFGGDDTLNGTEDAFQKRDMLTGGGGTDAFTADVLDQVFARDGIAERVGCKSVRFLTDPQAFVEVDLKDIIEFGDPCPVVLRAPKAEAPAATPTKGAVKVSGRRAQVRISCSTATACSGTVSLKRAKKGSAAVSASFKIAAGKTSVVRLKLRSADASKVTKKGTKAVVTVTEAGIAGERTVVRSVTLKR